MNAQMGLTSPGKIGADVGHLNLHKTFAIPHGGGGPGVGAVGAMKHLAPFLPGHSVIPIANRSTGAVNGAPYGNAGVLPISYSYIRMCGQKGLLDSARHSILISNYMASVLSKEFKITFKGDHGRVAHEFNVDLSELKKKTGISEEDVAKILMDFGSTLLLSHGPTLVVL